MSWEPVCDEWQKKKKKRRLTFEKIGSSARLTSSLVSKWNGRGISVASKLKIVLSPFAGFAVSKQEQMMINYTKVKKVTQIFFNFFFICAQHKNSK